jgi:hypothetical protein
MLVISSFENYIFKKKKCICMTKGIAIQTILMLLVGILVVGIVVYMVYRYFVGAPLQMEECRARAIAYCTGCTNIDPDGAVEGPNPSDGLCECAAQWFPGLGANENDCKTNAAVNCRAVGADPGNGWCLAFAPQ